jgi:hypothetical protein
MLLESPEKPRNGDINVLEKCSGVVAREPDLRWERQDERREVGRSQVAQGAGLVGLRAQLAADQAAVEHDDRELDLVAGAAQSRNAMLLASTVQARSINVM